MWNSAIFLHYLRRPYLIEGADITLGLSVAAMAHAMVPGLA